MLYIIRYIIKTVHDNHSINVSEVNDDADAGDGDAG